MRKIGIFGAGQAGLRLALDLLAGGYQAEIADGFVNGFDDSETLAAPFVDPRVAARLIQDSV